MSVSMPRGFRPHAEAKMRVQYLPTSRAARIEPREILVTADPIASHMLFAGADSAIAAARTASAKDHGALIVLRKPNGQYAVYQARVDAESGWFRLAPNWMRSVGVRSFTFSDFNAPVVAIVDGARIVRPPG